MNKKETKIIALRSPEETDDGWFYMYFEVPIDYDFDMMAEKFENDFRKIYNNDDYKWDWKTAFEEVSKKYGLGEEIGIEVTDLII